MVGPWNKSELETLPKKYSCHVVYTNATPELYKDKSLPTDCKLITYEYEGETYIDVVRSGKMVNVFDMYYDKFGSKAIKSITFGYGTVNPRNWCPKK